MASRAGFSWSLDFSVWDFNTSKDGAETDYFEILCIKSRLNDIKTPLDSGVCLKDKHEAYNRVAST